VGRDKPCNWLSTEDKDLTTGKSELPHDYNNPITSMKMIQSRFGKDMELLPKQIAPSVFIQKNANNHIRIVMSWDLRMTHIHSSTGI